MTEMELGIELLAAFLMGGLFMLVLPHVISAVRHRGIGHGFQHVFAFIHPDGIQRDMQLCVCGATKWIKHDGRVCTH